MTTAYLGRRRQGDLVLTRLPECTELTPDRSLGLVTHSPSGFEVGYRDSGGISSGVVTSVRRCDPYAMATVAPVVR